MNYFAVVIPCRFFSYLFFVLSFFFPLCRFHSFCGRVLVTENATGWIRGKKNTTKLCTSHASNTPFCLPLSEPMTIVSFIRLIQSLRDFRRQHTLSLKRSNIKCKSEFNGFFSFFYLGLTLTHTYLLHFAQLLRFNCGTNPKYQLVKNWLGF